MAVNDETTYVVPSLLALAYHSCNDDHRKWYDELPIPSVGLQICCTSLIKIIQLNSDVKHFQPHGDRRSMFSKVKSLVGGHLIKNICEMAASYGHVNCMMLARTMGVPWYSSISEDKSACDLAAESGSIECLIYAHENGIRWSSLTCSYAAANGHLDCLVYLHKNGCPWDHQTCTNAAQNGHLKCLIYARKNDCPWTADMCSLSTRGGVECLKYCRENGCSWDVSTCQMAVFLGSLECLKYARENGCPWDESVCDLAACFEQLECLRYAYENGCEWNVNKYLSYFSRFDNLKCVGYALEIKSTLTEDEQNYNFMSKNNINNLII